MLAEEARKENFTMRTLTEKGSQDAAAVKVLTIITLIYLPATVVSVSLTGSVNEFIDLIANVGFIRTSSPPNSSIRDRMGIPSIYL